MPNGLGKPLVGMDLAKKLNFGYHSSPVGSVDVTCECSRPRCKKKVYFYIAQYPDHRTTQSALHFISLANLFNQIPCQLLWEASSHMLRTINVRKAARTHIHHWLLSGTHLYS